MPHLPGAVHFISQAPVLDIVWLPVTMLFPELGIERALFHIAIFYPASCFLDGACSHINREIRRCANLPGIVYEFICAKLVGFQCAPGQFKPWYALSLGAHPIQPIIIGNKVATRVPYYRRMKVGYS